jgi:hypothetical protein
MRWFLRGLTDHETHAGTRDADGIVLAVCGAVFEPLPLPSGDVALPGLPADPSQTCTHCRRVIDGTAWKRR